MTVAELIEDLKKYDPELPVIMESYDGYLTKTKDVSHKPFDQTREIKEEHILLNPIL